MYVPSHDQPEDWDHKELGDCHWKCGCPGVGLDCVETGRAALARVIDALAMLPRPHHGLVQRHLDVAANIHEICTQVLTEVIPAGFRVNDGQAFRVMPDDLEHDVADVGVLQQPLRALADALVEAMRHPFPDERQVARDIFRVVLAARQYYVRLEMLAALGRTDFDWDLA